MKESQQENPHKRESKHSLLLSAVQALHLVMKGSLDLMSVGIGKEKRKKDTVAENTTSEKPGTDQKELGDVKCVQIWSSYLASSKNAV